MSKTKKTLSPAVVELCELERFSYLKLSKKKSKVKVYDHLTGTKITIPIDAGIQEVFFLVLTAIESKIEKEHNEHIKNVRKEERLIIKSSMRAFWGRQ